MTTNAAAIRSRIRPSGVVTLPEQPQPAPDAARCRCCNEPLETAWQPGMPGRSGFFIYTCRNSFCALRSYTFSDLDYPTLDLARYGATEYREQE